MDKAELNWQGYAIALPIHTKLIHFVDSGLKSPAGKL